MSERSYKGPALDGSVQWITERPHQPDRDEGETVYATPPEPAGKETVENVPVPDGGDPVERPDREGQTTLSDYGGGST